MSPDSRDPVSPTDQQDITRGRRALVSTPSHNRELRLGPQRIDFCYASTAVHITSWNIASGNAQKTLYLTRQATGSILSTNSVFPHGLSVCLSLSPQSCRHSAPHVISRVHCTVYLSGKRRHGSLSLRSNDGLTIGWGKGGAAASATST